MSQWVKIVKEGHKILLEDTRLSVGRKITTRDGFIELRDTPDQGLHIIRVNDVDAAHYIVRLHEDGVYRLCPQCGYRVMHRGEKMHPIERILRRRNISSTLLEIAREECVKVYESWYDNCAQPFAVVPTNRWHHDGTAEVIDKHIWAPPYGQFCGGGHNQVMITEATYAISVSYDGSRQHCISKIITWPECDPKVFDEVLQNIKKMIANHIAECDGRKKQ